jgi:ABC-type multidrug transport system fused ATPase/permease subunit
MKTFVIAHRLSIVRNASRILVFDAGRIVQAGTFDQLMAARGRFVSLA